MQHNFTAWHIVWVHCQIDIYFVVVFYFIPLVRSVFVAIAGFARGPCLLSTADNRCLA
jgi:hypothetical protein